ncbi:zf-HC2 domain-containing protein [Actinomadura terrae]|uniref:zf-HC2 domain-containing protein n=1 Tax=Actinomadura terrae TaxID=604353 RepID=UPI001FA71430|nr:zf-HC2 domain-containing protein [Actinomadura terrae]
MIAEPPHVDVGAYALGLLEDPDRRAFEGHLRSCPGCAEEFGALRGLAATLEGITPDAGPAPAPPEPVVVADLLRRRARRGRRRRAARAVTGLAAGAVLLAGAAGAGFTAGADHGTSARPEAEAPFPDGPRLTAADAATGASGTVTARQALWGSRVGLRLTRVRGPLECELVAVDRAGRGHPVAGWSVPAAGYGLPGSAAPMLTVQGGTALRRSDIARFEVRTTGDRVAGGGRVLLTVPA